MGLDITAYEKAALTAPHDFSDDCYDNGHQRAFVLNGFERSMRGLVGDRCYQVSGESLSFRAGSYGGYNDFRHQLSIAALGVDPKEVWDNPETYQDEPFFELINFADNEGTIGPEAAADLARDFREHRKTVLPLLDDYYQDRYGYWQRAFEIAAKGGLVDFH